MKHKKIVIPAIAVVLLVIITILVFIYFNNTNQIPNNVTIANENFMYTDKNGNTVIIPKGFGVSTFSNEQTIDNGLVILDSLGNEFVWIPVKNETEFILRDGYEKGELQTKVSSGETFEPYDVKELEGSQFDSIKGNTYKDEIAEYNKMKEQVLKNKGFYIARYEAGLPENMQNKIITGRDKTSKPISKKNVNVWNEISWGNGLAYTDATINTGAMERSKLMYEESEKYGIVSTLIYGVQWDAALKFIGDDAYYKDSANAGNYSDKLAKSGSNEAYARKNIYDMAGNLSEHTMESFRITSKVSRGGFYGGIDVSEHDYPASYRTTAGITKFEGFRVALYIK